MSQGTRKSSMPVCLFLSRLPKEEVQSLKADLAQSWNHVSVEPPYFKDFYYIPWSNILGTTATLRQIYYLIEQIYYRTGRSTCLLLDDMSALFKEAWLAQFDPSNNATPVLSLRKINDLSLTVQYILECEHGLKSPPKDRCDIQVRNPDMSVEALEGAGREMTSTLSPGVPEIALGQCILYPSSPIFSLFSFSNSDIDDFETKIDPGLTSAGSFHLSNIKPPCSGEGQVTRAMMYEIVTKALEISNDTKHGVQDVIIIDEQTKVDGSVLCTRFIDRSREAGYNVRRRGLQIARVPAAAVRIISEEFRQSLELEGIQAPKAYLDGTAYRETIWDPNMHLCIRKPLYLHQSHSNTFVFFLARFSENDEAAIKNDLEFSNDFLDGGDDKKNKYNYVPWASSQGVAPDDLKTWIPRYMSYLDESSDGAIDKALFIDNQGRTENPAFLADITSKTQYCVILAQCKWHDKVLKENRTTQLDTMDILWQRVPARQAQFYCAEFGYNPINWEILPTHYQRIRTSKAERNEMAKLGKFSAEAGFYNVE